MTMTLVSRLEQRRATGLGWTLLTALGLVGCAAPPSIDPSAPAASPTSVATPQLAAAAAQVGSAAPAATASDLPALPPAMPAAHDTLPAQSAQSAPELSAARPGASATPQALALAALLRDAYQFRLLSASQQAAEMERLERLERQHPEAEHRLRMALALAQTLQIPDTQRALALVQTVLESNDPQSVALRPLAHLLGHLLREQRRLELQNERLSQQVRDSQRRVEQLSDRIEAMRAIERSLQRPAPLTAPPQRPNAP